MIMCLKRYFSFLIIVLLVGIVSCSKDKIEDPIEDESEIIDRSKIPSFPGAQGGGMYTLGGAGGDVYAVTSLEDTYSEGTLRFAVEQIGARTIVFEVNGTIKLTRALKIQRGDLTIAGQTAPGDGITIKNYPVIVDADNVIIRFLRFRMGDEKAMEADAIEGQRRKNIIIDHCSMSWGTDECVSFYDNENFTLQWSLIAESLNRSVHEKGDHGYGGLWGGYNATFYGNMLAHHKSRNPRFYGLRDGVIREKAEMVNNVIYNWGDNSAYGGEGGSYNLINNYYKAGPGTKKHRSRIFEAYKTTEYGKFYISGNYVHGFSEVTNDNWKGVQLNGGGNMDDLKMDLPFSISGVLPLSAEEAYEEVLNHVGMSMHRDEVDSRFVEEVKTGTATYGGVWGSNSGIIDSQTDVGGWPESISADAPVDVDGDGIPDSWEIAKGLNPKDASDGKNYSLSDEYTNLEVYLNQLVSDKIKFGK